MWLWMLLLVLSRNTTAAMETKHIMSEVSSSSNELNVKRGECDRKASQSVQGTEQRRLPNLDERSVKAKDYPDVLAAIGEVYRRQCAWPEFFLSTEDGNTVHYAIFVKGEIAPRLYRGAIPAEVLRTGEFVFIQNVDRAKRPGRPGSRQPRLAENDPRVWRLLPETIINEYGNEFWGEWIAPSGHLWWVTMQLCAIWPPKLHRPTNEQPLHCVVSRADGRVTQSDMNKAENLRDILTFVTELNRAAVSTGQPLFRGAINGWYYSEAPDAQKAGPSQALSHGQGVRYEFPIEWANFTPRFVIGPVTVSTLADGYGTGIRLEAADAEIDRLVDIIEQTLQRVTQKGHSFNVLIAPGAASCIRAFIADRPVGTPDPLFTNEWAFSEFGRAFVIDSPSKFYKMTLEQEAAFEALQSPVEQVQWTKQQRAGGFLHAIHPDLRKNAIEALKMVTAPQAEVDEILQHLKDVATPPI